MKKEINILKHSYLNQFISDRAFSGQNHAINNFSVFRVDFQDQQDPALSLLKKSFRSDFFSLIRVVSGEMSIRIDFNNFEITTNCMFIAAPNSIKQINYVKPGCIIEGISFTADFLKEIKINENIAGVMEFFSSKNISMWQLQENESSLFSELVIRMSKRVNALDIHTYGLELLANSFSDFLYEIAEIGKKHISPAGLTYGRKEELVMKYVRLAMANHLREKSLSFYATRLFVTAKHLSEMTKEITGKTAGQIIDELTIMEARRLLEETNLDIAEIAYRLQFSSPAFFSKFFRRLNGQSPRNYRTSFTTMYSGKATSIEVQNP